MTTLIEAAMARFKVGLHIIEDSHINVVVRELQNGGTTEE